MEVPMLKKWGTKHIFNPNPDNAPIREADNKTLSFFRGVMIWTDNIWESPTINTVGIIIIIGITAFSYPLPAITYIISDAMIVVNNIKGIHIEYIIENEWLTKRLKLLLSFCEINAFILGNITLVKEEKKARTMEYNLYAVV